MRRCYGCKLPSVNGGAAVVEIGFSIPGLDKLIVDATSVKNAPMVKGGSLFIVVVMTFNNLITDII